ncbi:MAG TPA: hypothetical protein VIO36_12755 [Anaerolineaceae bacterium]
MSPEDIKTVRYGMPGRPPRSPKNKVGTPVRCLVTIGVEAAIETAARAKGLNVSDFLRLAIYHQLEDMDLMSGDLRKDATWDTLRGFNHL